VVASIDPVPAADPDGRLRITDLRDQPLVMFRAGYDLRDATLDACRRAGFLPSFTVEGGEMDAVLSLVEAGLGAAVVPDIVVAGRPALRVTQFAPPGMRRTIALAHRSEIVLAHAAQALRDTLLAQLRESSASGALPPGVELLPPR
jgi:DNA-binding transcriptional LysR family regulator